MTPDPMDDLIQEAERWKTTEQPRDHMEAVAWVKGVFQRMKDQGAFQAGVDTTAFLLDHTYNWAIREPERYLGLAEKDPVWFNGLRAVAAEMLRRNDQMPKQLATWVADVLMGIAKEPNPSRGRPPANVHQTAVWLTVSQLVIWKWKATRNDASPALSASDVVADATGMSFKRVKEIAKSTWRRPRYLLKEWQGHVPD